jgi:hypothetical protein
MCPRRLPGILIVRGVLTYYLVYRNVASSNFVCYQYSPTKEGGLFRMPSAVLHKYPVLSEFAYLKMMAVEILWSLNSHRASGESSPVCKGVLDCKSKKSMQLVRRTRILIYLPKKNCSSHSWSLSINSILTPWCVIQLVCITITSGMVTNH